jgi:periplasmic copper chaperone A
MVRQGSGCIAIAMHLFLAALIAPPSVNLAQAQDRPGDQAEIRELMRKTWERPDAPLSVEPVVVVDDYAIAGWVQDDRGGRALLRRKHGAWDVILCSGDQLRTADTVRATGATDDIARRLVARLLDAESSMAPGRLAKLSLFDGIVRMDGGKSHHGH